MTAQSGGLDFYTVAQHEIGHSLGLSHRYSAEPFIILLCPSLSPVYNSVMYPYYKGKDKTGIDYDDVLAMYELYSK